MIIRKIHGNIWFAIFSFIFIYNFNVSYGFVGFTMGLPVFFFFVYMLMKYREARSHINGIIIMIMLCILFFIHILPAVLAVAIFFIVCLYDNKGAILKLFFDIIILIPMVALMLWWILNDVSQSNQSTIDYILKYYRTEYLDTLSLRGAILFLDNFALFEGLWGNITGAVFFLVSVLPLMYFILFRTRYFTHIVSQKPNDIIFFIAIASLLLYIILPQDIPEKIHLFYHRFSAIFILSTIILGSRLVKSTMSGMVGMSICFAAILHFLLWAGYFYDFKKATSDFVPDIFPVGLNKKRLAGLIYDYKFRGRPIFIHFPDYNIVWNRGITSTFLIDSGFGSFGSTQRRADFMNLPVYQPWVGKHNNYDGRYRNMDYILVRGRFSNDAKQYMQGFELIRETRNWSIYSNLEN